MISFIVVNYKGDKWVDILLRSIAGTISHKNYEVVVVNNSKTNLDYSKYQSVRTVDNTDLKETGSMGHAKGLLKGYQNLDKRTRTVILVDQDVAFLRKNWDKDITRYLIQEPLVGAPQETSYQKHFLRPHFLAFNRAFFDKEILFNDGLMPNLPIGDTAYRLSLFAIRNKVGYKVLPNSYNWEIYGAAFENGETIYNLQEKPICHHVGRSVPKPKRFDAWKEFYEKTECV
jgi:hypothetical protein